MGLCFQNSDGGFPETFPRDASGCWTTAEIYAALSQWPDQNASLSAHLGTAEEFLLRAFDLQGDGGLPYYSRSGNAGAVTSLSAVDPTAAFLSGWRMRHPEEGLIRGRLESWLRSARAAPEGGWGVRPGDGRPRTYSTTVAILALGGGEPVAKDARALLSWRDAASGAWPFRPGVAPSAVGTALALSALAAAGVSVPVEDLSVSWLLDRLEDGLTTEEDSSLVDEGYQLSFDYAPRFCVLATVLQHLARRADGLPEVLFRRAVAALAVSEEAFVRSERPCPSRPDVRVWHFLDPIWAWPQIVGALHGIESSVSGFAPGLLAETYSRERFLARWRTFETLLPTPLRGAARGISSPRTETLERSRLLLTHAEQVFAFVEATLLAAAVAEGRGDLVLEQLGNKRSGIRGSIERTLQTLKALPPCREDLAGRLRLEIAGLLHGRSLSREVLARILDLRNQTAHGSPIGDARVVREICEAWTEALAALPALTEADLVELERLGHEVGTGRHFYQWTALDDRSRTGVTRDVATFPDVVSVGGSRTFRAVFVRDRRNPEAPPLSLLPFVVLAVCPACLTERLFVWHDVHLTGSDIHRALTLELRCSADTCGRIERFPLPANFWGPGSSSAAG